MVSWDKYLAPCMLRIVRKCPPVHVLDRRDIKPRWGAYIVALGLVGIILNLVTYPGFYDVARRDFGLLLAGIGFGTLVTSL